MTFKSKLGSLSWPAGGTVVLVALILLALHYRQDEDLAEKSALQTTRIRLVGRMRTSLSTASEAEKSAVMATTDAESRDFAEQARAASAGVEAARDEMGKLLETGGFQRERDLLSEFSRDLVEYQRIDRELLDLAVRNSNLKGYGLAFGPAAEAIAEVDSALSHVLTGSAASVNSGAGRVMWLAADARSRALWILALLPPHISEESEPKMDELESRMADQDHRVRADLKELEARLGTRNPDLETATAGYDRFSGLKARILDLSRQNTNVRSVMISLNQKRKAAEACQDALTALGEAIEAEPLIRQPPERPR